jgi:hypothetical protein
MRRGLVNAAEELRASQFGLATPRKSDSPGANGAMAESNPFPQGRAGKADGALQGSIGDYDSRPDGGQKLILVDHSCAIFDQEGKDAKNARLQLYYTSIQAQFPGIVVQFKSAEMVDAPGYGAGLAAHRKMISN